MPTLADFLKTENERLRATQPQRDALLPEWMAAVERLLTQIEAWVGAADTEGLLEVARIGCPVSEENMGRYTVPGLVVRLKTQLRDRALAVVPKARFTVARVPSGAGGVELPTAGLVRIAPPELALGSGDSDCYRVVTDLGDRWYHHRTRWGRTPVHAGEPVSEYVPFGREIFEQLLVAALR